MIVDNINSQLKAYEWLERYKNKGTLNIVTGYFTIGALAYLASLLHEHIQEFNFVLGDIVHTKERQERPLDLLNENIALESALRLSVMARQAVSFLQQENVNVKTLEPNFCHAKAYLFHHASNVAFDHYFLTGSSNLTEAGIGLKSAHNVELNIGGQGTDANYEQLKQWFEKLWSCPQAHEDKIIDGQKIPFKHYLINEIEKLFVIYTPRELYYKVLFELFGEQLLTERTDPHFNRQIGRLENTVIYNALYEFQRKGALSLINMLQKYHGAILADAVGLGKTWTALAVMKFFQLQGFEVILLCPKKLEQNWRQYLARHYSRFEEDRFDYVIRFHTDLQGNRLESYQDGVKIREYFQSDRPKLLVIDESHHLRNAKSNRYKYLVETLLKQNEDIKVLMLSATPINNTLLDIRNQFKLIVKDDPKGFKETLGIQNIDYTFRTAQKAFHEWRTQEQRTIGAFIKKLPVNFFKLTDALTVAKTRKMILGQTDQLIFPQKAKPVNLFVTPKQIGHFDTFEEMFAHFPPKLSAYQPSFYVEQAEDVDVLRDERLRDYFLVKMMYILMVKRLESSWFSFRSTVEKILAHHDNALRKINLYLEQKHPTPGPSPKERGEDPTPTLPGGEGGFSPSFGGGQGEVSGGGVFDFMPETEMFDEIEDLDVEELTLGKKRKVRLAEIDRAGNLEVYRNDLKQDIERLDSLRSNLYRFEQAIQDELDTRRNHTSKDTKLEALIAHINQKRSSGNNHQNQKVLIFTVFKDTAFYLFDQLRARGFTRIAVVSGDEAKTDDAEHSQKNFEPILERFAPYTKLFMEKEWKAFTPPHQPHPQPLPKGEGSTPPPLEGAGGRFPRARSDGSPRFFHTSPEKWKILKEFARNNRKNPTKAEDSLWQHLRKKQLGYRFRRQHAIGDFVADFVCVEEKLVVEVDGEAHEHQQAYDEARTDILQQYQFRVIRFWNWEVEKELQRVLQTIRAELEKPHPRPLPKGEGSTPPSFGGRPGGWSSSSPSEGAGGWSAFEAWKIWVSEHYPHIKSQLDHPIDLLIATDCLSEGQNLQDCDFVVNYDIHWNPVRVIQRMGRIDRLGSPNEVIYGVNFWPSENINAYLDLQNRIENRMIAMKLAGSEVDQHFTDTLTERIEDEAFEQSQNARMLQQMQISWDDIEVSEQGLGFEDLSLEQFRQDLFGELAQQQEKYANMPNGLYTGFHKEPEVCPQNGMIALLGYPAKPSGVRDVSYESYELIYIDAQGNSVLLNQKEVLEALAHHKDQPRIVPEAIDRGDAEVIASFHEALTVWLKRQAVEEEEFEGGTKATMGKSAKDLLEKLKTGDGDAVNRLKQNVKVEDKYQAENFDLIVWFVVR